MNRMTLKCALLFFIGTAFCVAAAAQTYKKTKQDLDDWAAKRTEMMTKNLSLNSEQVKKVKEINLDYARKMDGVSGSAWTKLDDERDAEFKKVLTADQYTKWQGNKKDWLDKLKATWDKTKKKVGDAADDVKDKAKELSN